MSEPFLAEIKIFSFDFAPKGWSFCDGQVLPINQNQALYSLLGTTYGGDGRTSFALPNLQGRTALHVDANYREGSAGGEATHTLSVQEIPAHKHNLLAVAPADGSQNTNNPSNAFLSNSAPAEIYSNGAGGALTPMGATSVANYGSSQGHDNMQPYLALNFCIALRGLFPSRN